MKALKVIFHIDESEKWGLLLANVNNLLSDVGQDNMIVVVLANSVAVKEYVANEENSQILGKIKALAKKDSSWKTFFITINIWTLYRLAADCYCG